MVVWGVYGVLGVVGGCGLVVAACATCRSRGKGFAHIVEGLGKIELLGMLAELEGSWTLAFCGTREHEVFVYDLAVGWSSRSWITNAEMRDIYENDCKRRRGGIPSPP